MSQRTRIKTESHRTDNRRWAARLALLSFCLLTGCAGNNGHLFAAPPAPGDANPPAKASADADSSSGFDWKYMNPSNWFRPKPPPGAADEIILRGDKLVPDAHPADNKAMNEMAGAHELYRRGDYENAERIFHEIAENTKNPPPIAEEARFYEAESLRRQQHYPKACDTYHKLLLDFPNNAYREQCVNRMFDIANYWLEDTRHEMEAQEKHTGTSWIGWAPVVHWEKAKPFLDEEGRAIEALEHVRFNDITGPLADKSLFLCGSVKFFREDYRGADQYFTSLVEMYPNSKLASQAVELGIVAKHMSTGGADYDGRKVAEARQLVNTALHSYPDLARDPDKRDFLMRELVNCNLQQAEKDFKIAEFYRRTGHPGAAYFYYEIVRRRYPGLKYAEEATRRMNELHAAAVKEQQENMPAMPAAQPETGPMPRHVPAAGPVETAPPPRSLPGDSSVSPRP